MYRLPTQFDASASRQDLAAAGGGSTSTTCSSCIVTLIGSSVVSAMVLGALEPLAPASSGPAQATVDVVDSSTVAADPPPEVLQQSPIAPDPDLLDTATANATSAVPVAGQSRTTRVLLGLFALPLAALGGGLFMGIGSAIFGLFVAVAVFVGIYALVYERSGRPLGRGIGIGIVLLLGLFVASALEMMLWLGLMK